MIQLIFILILIILTLILIIYWLVKKNRDLRFKKQSLSVKYGKLTEQFLPLLELYPYDEANFRFLGNPIDGIQFEPNKIIFVEFKTADSELNQKQKQIKNLILKKKVKFEEIRIPPKKGDKNVRPS